MTVVGCPFRVDRLTGVDPVGCDRRRLQLGDQMLATGEQVQPRCPADASRDRRPRGCDPARLDVQQLAQAQTFYGDWRELFRSVDKIDKVTAADVRRVANATFSVNNRTIAYVDNTPAKAASATAPKGESK